MAVDNVQRGYNSPHADPLSVRRLHSLHHKDHTMIKFTGDELMRIKTVLVEAQKENGREPYCGASASRSDYARWDEWATRRALLTQLIDTFEKRGYT